MAESSNARSLAESSTGSTAARVLAIAATIGATIAALGCSSASEGRAEIYAFRASIATGAEGSDSKVALCWTVEGQEECKDLSSDGNDFESRTTRAYSVRPAKRIPEAVPITRLRLKYTAGPFTVGDEWELAGVTVTAFLANDTNRVLCEQSGSSVRLSPGDSYTCPMKDASADP